MEITTGNFRLAHAADGDWRALVEDCIEQLADASPAANLGFVYVTDALDESFERIAGRLRDATGIDDWVGTIGFGVCVGGREYFDQPAMTRSSSASRQKPMPQPCSTRLGSRPERTPRPRR